MCNLSLGETQRKPSCVSQPREPGLPRSVGVLDLVSSGSHVLTPKLAFTYRLQAPSALKADLEQLFPVIGSVYFAFPHAPIHRSFRKENLLTLPVPCKPAPVEPDHQPSPATREGRLDNMDDRLREIALWGPTLTWKNLENLWKTHFHLRPAHWVIFLTKLLLSDRCLERYFWLSYLELINTLPKNTLLLRLRQQGPTAKFWRLISNQRLAQLHHMGNIVKIYLK